jgi:hypothetical protein
LKCRQKSNRTRYLLGLSIAEESRLGFSACCILEQRTRGRRNEEEDEDEDEDEDEEDN